VNDIDAVQMLRPNRHFGLGCPGRYFQKLNTGQLRELVPLEKLSYLVHCNNSILSSELVAILPQQHKGTKEFTIYDFQFMVYDL
jgi:hypothetical protein